MRKLSFILLGVFAVVGVIIFTLVVKQPKHVIHQEAMFEPRELQVTFRENGCVRAKNRIEIKSPFGGRIEEILVNEGDEVKRGQIVIHMSSHERAAMMDLARAQGKAEYIKWQDFYKTAPIVVPTDGFVIWRSKEPGQTVSSDDAILVMTNELVVIASIDEADLKYIKLGDKLKMILDSYPNVQFEGIVDHIPYEARIENNVVIYFVRIKPLRKPEIFRSGMSATIIVTSESKKNVWSIPSNFIVKESQKKIVLVKIETAAETKYEKRSIKTGISDGNYTEIVEGLRPGEIVVKFSEKVKKSKIDNVRSK